MAEKQLNRLPSIEPYKIERESKSQNLFIVQENH